LPFKSKAKKTFITFDTILSKMPTYSKVKHALVSLGLERAPRGLSKFQARWRGKKARKSFRGNNRGYLTKGKWVYVK
jgi:hypothetical protein